MFFRKSAYLMLVLCLWAGGSAFGQSDAPESGSFVFPKGKNKVRIPFKSVHNLVIIPLQINNSKPLHFVVDTGVDRTLIIEAGMYDSISLNNVTFLMLRGLGRGAGIQAVLSKNNRLRFAGLEAGNQEVMVLEQNVFDISARVGMEINGIIGYPLFRDFVVEIDYASKVMTLYKPGYYPKKRARKTVAIPISIEDKKPYVHLQAVAANGERHRVKLIIDSGMSSSVMLYPSSLPDSALPQKTIAAFIGRGLNGDIHGSIGRIKALSLGKFELERPAAAFPDSLSIRHALGQQNRHGNLGADVLQRFHVVFDYPNGQLLVMPNSMFKKPFYFNLSGMELTNPIPGVNFYSVAAVLPNSPAERAGLKIGDGIIGINGLNCFSIPFQEALNYFQNRPGRKLRLKVSRGSTVFHTSLTLQDMI